ncbi:hypothetical protein [Pseudomonas bohemica]|uniref:hypothetical protein n=1 Tax=Pseudomonas bohemica TaxID=2044872 RepID=UPI000DA618D2|nr:hypothetical protein [Pseudomonas bohemica]
MVPIGLSRMGSFRIGTIWQSGKCIAEADFGQEYEASVDFTDGAWSMLSVPGKHNIPYLRQDHELRRTSTNGIVSELLSFPLPGRNKNLLIPCIEFLFRCYGSTSDIPRILVTYPWEKVLTKLYATFEHDNPETWAVSPADNVPDSDALLLATLRYNKKAELVARRLHAQLDNALADNKALEKSLQVEPWFEGPARLRMRGRWINGGKTFLCLEVTGMSEPQHHSYDIRREKQSEEQPEPPDPATPLKTTTIDRPKDQDPFRITDQLEPGGNAGSWGTPDPHFVTLGTPCPFTRTPIARPRIKRETMSVEVAPPFMFSTGDPQGGHNGVSHIYHRAKRIIGNGGVLSALWAELQHLKQTYPGFTSLAWYSEKQGFVHTPDFRLYPLKAFAEDDRLTEGASAWLKYSDNATLRRGLLLIQVVIRGQTFYLFELQRKKRREGNAFKDEQISGLVVNINDPQKARELISTVCDQIRNAMGKFAQLDIPDFPHKVFRHYSRKGVFTADVTLRKAFEPLGIYLPHRK